MINSSKVSKDAHGGFHDAGNYNKYVPTASELLAQLIFAWDIDSSKFFDDQWNLPESGINIPDIIDDMMWELDWMIRTQDSVDGGMYHKVSSCNFYFGMPETEPLRFIFRKTVQDTAVFAANAAAVGRIVSDYNNYFLFVTSRTCLELFGEVSQEPGSKWIC